MNDKESALLIGFLKILGNEDRLGIIRLLKQYDEMCAKDIGARFYLEQSTTSHHLNIMRRMNLVRTVKRGRNIFYSLDELVLRKMLVKVEEK
eukprot:COSAG06_NODE_18662_length_875_cov_0.784794_2_plen_92_part_00